MLDFQHFRCRRIRSLFWDYASDRLPESLLEQVENHLTGCAGCRQEMDGLRKAQALLFAARSETPPRSQTNWQQLRAKIEAEEGRPQTLAGGSALVSAGRWNESGPAHRRLPRAASWMPNLAMASTFACLMLTAAMGYRLFVVVPRRASNPGDMDKPSMSGLIKPVDTGNIASNRTAKPLPHRQDLSGTSDAPITYVSVPIQAFTTSAEPELNRSSGRIAAEALPLRQQEPPMTLVSYHKSGSSVPAFHRESKKEFKQELKPNSGKMKEEGFRPYHGPQEKLPETDPSSPRYPLDRIVPVGNDAQGALAMENLRPSPPDEERAY